MSSFTSPLIVKRLDGKDRWQVVEEFTYEVGIQGSGMSIHVPAGQETDFASIPRGLWNVFPPVGGKYDKAAVLHDYLYRGGVVVLRIDSDVVKHVEPPKETTDLIFLEAMEVLGVGWLARHTIYMAVRLGGGHAWSNGHKGAK